MKQNILVIGGSYFAGRVFVMLANHKGYHVTVINRGKYSMAQYEHVEEFVFDRKVDDIAKLPLQKHYDAIVDFCAYEKNDVKKIINNLPCTFGKYIFISTADVYERPHTSTQDETSPVINNLVANEVGEYVYQKMLLEKELMDARRNHFFSYVILRPAFIFGPFNYAPRESFYIKQILQKRPLPILEDSGGKFNMVYVKDVAKAILLSIEHPSAKDAIYNISAPEVMDYNAFIDVLRNVSDVAFTTQAVSQKEVLTHNLPLPFPLTEAENELFDGNKIVQELDFSYTEIQVAMKETYENFKKVFGY